MSGERPDTSLSENTIRQLERLAASGVAIVPTTEITTHFVLEREGFLILVERTEEGFGSVGSPGLLCDQGFAALIWKGQEPYWVARGFSQAATPEQVASVRDFAAIVKNCLTG